MPRPGIPILDTSDPGLYRNQRGRVGSDPLMQADTGPGGRYLITSGQSITHDAGDLIGGWRNVFRPSSVAFSVLVLGTLLMLIHARADVAIKAAVSR